MKRIALTLCAVVALFATALPAQAYGPVHTYTTGVWREMGALDCPSGQTVHLRSWTHDFFWFDSTGTTTMRYAQALPGTVYKLYSNVEHDGVTRTWDTGKNWVVSSSIKVTYVWTDGIATISTFCA